MFAGIRGHQRDFDWITRYRIDENGGISSIGRTPADKIPWGFTLSPQAEYLFVTAHQGATITAYKIGIRRVNVLKTVFSISFQEDNR